MRRFEDFNPIALTVYFLCAAGVVMFSMDPFLISVSLLGAFLCFVLDAGLTEWKTHFYTLILFIVTAVINPIVSHNGKTVLFVLNDNPVTLESCLYGLTAAGMIAGIFSDHFTWQFYPVMRGRPMDAVVICLHLLYLALGMTPVFLHWHEERNWKKRRKEAEA